MEQRIMFVDDEEAILSALERLFFDAEYEVLTAKSGEEALALLKEEPVDIVVSDMRMPAMDGHHFLRQVKNLYPGTTRLILSGYAEEREILNSLIDGSCSLYLFKPWDNDSFRKKMEQILEARQLYTNSEMLNLANCLDNLSVVAGIYNTVCKLIEQDAEISDISKEIEKDPAVTASILRVVNSAFYNTKTGSLLQAITFLGLSTIKSIVLTCSLQKALTLKVPPFNAAFMSKKADMTNLYFCRLYKEYFKAPVPDSLTTAGILHNIGLMIGVHYYPEKYRQIVELLSNNKDLDLIAAEKKIMGVSHAELGGYLLNWWEIPYPIVECALFHHDPMHKAVINREVLSLVHIASHFAWKNIYPGYVFKLDDNAFHLLGTNQKTCEKLLLNS